mmetsp:Transcript_5617/g.16360  ORF Transcript_5617/g.16360 Transcript_5617/m.16360 type:complete len:268 (-) Transcript_5617:306-1109(-)
MRNAILVTFSATLISGSGFKRIAFSFRRFFKASARSSSLRRFSLSILSFSNRLFSASFKRASSSSISRFLSASFATSAANDARNATSCSSLNNLSFSAASFRVRASLIELEASSMDFSKTSRSSSLSQYPSTDTTSEIREPEELNNAQYGKDNGETPNASNNASEFETSPPQATNFSLMKLATFGSFKTSLQKSSASSCLGECKYTKHSLYSDFAICIASECESSTKFIKQFPSFPFINVLRNSFAASIGSALVRPTTPLPLALAAK